MAVGNLDDLLTSSPLIRISDRCLELNEDRCVCARVMNLLDPWVIEVLLVLWEM